MTKETHVPIVKPHATPAPMLLKADVFWLIVPALVSVKPDWPPPEAMSPSATQETVAVGLYPVGTMLVQTSGPPEPFFVRAPDAGMETVTTLPMRVQVTVRLGLVVAPDTATLLVVVA